MRARVDLGDAVDGRVEECPVVGDQHERAPVGDDEAGQPRKAVGVQVVRRFVEEQEVRLGRSTRGERRARAASPPDSAVNRRSSAVPSSSSAQTDAPRASKSAPRSP